LAEPFHCGLHGALTAPARETAEAKGWTVFELPEANSVPEAMIMMFKGKQMTINFAPGDLVRARGREWVALPAPREGILALRPLSGSENDMVILDPELEMLRLRPHASICRPTLLQPSSRRQPFWLTHCA
jgi:hypothetical protein